MVGPLPKTERGKEYTCTCLFGKWPEAEALKNKLQLLRQSLFSVWCVEMVACFISFRPGSQVCKCICKAVDKYIGAWRCWRTPKFWMNNISWTSYIERKLAPNYVYGDDLTLCSASLQELTTPLAQVTMHSQTNWRDVRFNRSVWKLVNEEQTNWDKYVDPDPVLFACHTGFFKIPTILPQVW